MRIFLIYTDPQVSLHSMVLTKPVHLKTFHFPGFQTCLPNFKSTLWTDLQPVSRSVHMNTRTQTHQQIQTHIHGQERSKRKIVTLDDAETLMGHLLSLG